MSARLREKKKQRVWLARLELLAKQIHGSIGGNHLKCQILPSKGFKYHSVNFKVLNREASLAYELFINTDTVSMLYGHTRLLLYRFRSKRVCLDGIPKDHCRRRYIPDYNCSGKVGGRDFFMKNLQMCELGMYV